MTQHGEKEPTYGSGSNTRDDQTPRSLPAVVADKIRGAILSGALNPGERLVEERLAEQMNVSRHPVRQALRTLQLEGFVDVSPRRGATVSKITSEEASDLFEVLAVLDGVAAGLAAQHGSAAAISQVDQVLDRADAILNAGSGDITAGDLATLATLNHEFHARITEAGNNRQLIELIASLRDRVQWIQVAVNRRRPELSWTEHRQIRNAIASQDRETAEHLARAHIEAARIVYISQRVTTRGQALESFGHPHT